MERIVLDIVVCTRWSGYLPTTCTFFDWKLAKRDESWVLRLVLGNVQQGWGFSATLGAKCVRAERYNSRQNRSAVVEQAPF